MSVMNDRGHNTAAATLSASVRTLILGCPGSGKTALSRWLCTVSGLPLIHLDDEYWGPGWRRPDNATWIERQRVLVSSPSWIIDGNYLPTVELRAAQAQAALIVDTPTLVCAMRIVRRAGQIRAGQHDALPAAVRTEVGTRPKATRDLPQLLRKVLAFRRCDYWCLLHAAGGGSPDAPAVVILTSSPQ